MKIRLGIITTQAHIEYLKTIEETFRPLCKIDIIRIDDPREAQEAYLKNAPLVDGFVFSGRFIFDGVDPKCLRKDKPVRILQESEILLYRELFRLLLTEPKLDISRIYIDFAYVLDSFQEFLQYLPRQEKPIQNSNLFEQMENMLENHLSMWAHGKTDLSITAFGHFVPELQKHGVRYLLIQPSCEHMQEVVSGLIGEVTILKLQKRRTVIGYISSDPSSSFKADELSELQRLAEEFMREMNLSVSMQVSEQSIRLLTTYGDFQKITSDAVDCALIRYFQSRVPYVLKIGWGLGQEYMQANENAARALQQAIAYPGSCSFFVNEELKVIGPLRSKEVIQFSEHGDSETVALADEIGMNNINLQKIMSYAKMAGTNKLTSEDVAKCLSITVRGANRILNKIEEKKQAKSIFERLDSGKGRPKKYYELMFLDKDGGRLFENS